MASEKFGSRWCIICGISLVKVKDYYRPKLNIAVFKLLKDVLLDETIDESSACFVCAKCYRKLNNVTKLESLKEDMKRDYWNTKDDHDKSVGHLIQQVTDVCITPKSKGPQSQKRVATFSPGTPTSKAPVKRRPVTDAKRTLASAFSSFPATQSVSTPIQETSRNIPVRSRIPVLSPRSSKESMDTPIQETSRNIPVRSRIPVLSPHSSKEKSLFQRLAVRPRTKLNHSPDSLNTTDEAKVIQDDFLNVLQNEARSLCLPASASTFRQHDTDSLTEFKFRQQEEELAKHAPCLLATVKAISESEMIDTNTEKTRSSVLPKQMTAVSILLNTRNQHMNSHQVINSLILKESACKKDAYLRFSTRGVASSYGTVQKVQTDIGKGFDDELKKWAKEMEMEMEKEDKLRQDQNWEGLERHNNSRQDKGFQLVMDNVDVVVQARHPTRNNYGTDHHMVNMLAIENRVTAHHLSNETPAFTDQSIKSEMFLPSVEDNLLLKKEWMVLCGRIISTHMPKVKGELKDLPSTIPHKHMREARIKSKVVDLGVLMHNENTSEGIYHIMHHLHSYVPGHGTSNVRKIISAGDLLTCERESSCIEEQRNSNTPSQRLKGLVPVIADFHALANYYQVMWKLLYDPTSAANKGTLYQARNFLKTNNVTQDPIKNINAAEHLIEQYTIALVLAAALEFFGMKDCEDEPSKNLFQLDVHGDYKNYANTIMGSFVDNFSICESVSFKEKDFRCQKCNKTYGSRKGLQKHMKTKHPHHEPSQSPNTTSEDGVFNYSRVALGMCLLAMDFRDARKLGDGGRIIRLYKFLLLHCKAAKKPKYSLHILRLLAQVYVFLSPRLSYELVWNRFANPSGRPDGNIEPDRLMEHHNRPFKESCRGLRGNFSQKNIKRISRSSQKISEVLEEIDKEVPRRKRRASSRHKVDRKDAVALAIDLHSQQIFEYQPGRMHYKFAGFPSSHFNVIDPPSLHEWITNTIRALSRKSVFSER